MEISGFRVNMIFTLQNKLYTNQKNIIINILNTRSSQKTSNSSSVHLDPDNQQRVKYFHMHTDYI